MDEPDVYMHADLQRRLIRFLRNKHPQLILATHSIEIMGEVEPDNVLVVDRGRHRPDSPVTSQSLDDVVHTIGGIHNLQLARLWNSKRCLFVEGDDVGILKRIEDVLFPDSAETIEVLPRISVGGWGGWQYVIGASMLLEKNIGRDFITYCILDGTIIFQMASVSDYAKQRSAALICISGKVKEIENFLLCASAISRVIYYGKKPRRRPTEAVVEKEISRITDQMKDGVFDAFSQEHLSADRSGGVATANKLARTHLAGWNDPAKRLRIVSGKAVLSELSRWSKEEYDVSFNAQTVAAAMEDYEVPNELARIVTAIHDASIFHKRQAPTFISLRICSTVEIAW